MGKGIRERVRMSVREDTDQGGTMRVRAVRNEKENETRTRCRHGKRRIGERLRARVKVR